MIRYIVNLQIDTSAQIGSMHSMCLVIQPVCGGFFMDRTMAEGRMLKKVVSTSRKLANLKTDSARLLWTWVLPHADITGRFSAEPDVIKGYIVPRLKKMTAPKIETYLRDMAECNLIILYKVNGDNYLEIVKFHDFQSLRADREAESLIPPPPTPGCTPGVAPENSRTSKDKVSKDKTSEDKLNKEKEEPSISGRTEQPEDKPMSCGDRLRKMRDSQ